jgi:hypothetical protein
LTGLTLPGIPLLHPVALIFSASIPGPGLSRRLLWALLSPFPFSTRRLLQAPRTASIALTRLATLGRLLLWLLPILLTLRQEPAHELQVVAGVGMVRVRGKGLLVLLDGPVEVPLACQGVSPVVGWLGANERV